MFRNCKYAMRLVRSYMRVANELRTMTFPEFQRTREYKLLMYDPSEESYVNNGNHNSRGIEVRNSGADVDMSLYGQTYVCVEGLERIASKCRDAPYMATDEFLTLVVQNENLSKLRVSICLYGEEQ